MRSSVGKPTLKDMLEVNIHLLYLLVLNLVGAPIQLIIRATLQFPRELSL